MILFFRTETTIRFEARSYIAGRNSSKAPMLTKKKSFFFFARGGTVQEKSKVRDCAKKAERWLFQKLDQQANIPPSQNPVGWLMLGTR